MSDDVVKIEATIRQSLGKNYCRKLRVTGKIPGNIMDKASSVAIELDPKWLSKAWKSTKQFDLVLDGVTRKVKIHELQVNPVKRSALHVDLMYV